ncbi:MAG: nucleoside-diphosphate kinase [Conexivisphaera sp.]
MAEASGRNEERTLVVVKPDAVSRGLVGEILSRFERKGFRIVELRMIRLERNQAEDFYSPHKGKDFFEDLISFITSGPVVAAVLEGRNAIEAVRILIGPTDSSKAPPGTVRGDLGLGLTANVIHASDSKEAFEREVEVLFPGFLSREERRARPDPAKA